MVLLLGHMMLGLSVTLWELRLGDTSVAAFDK